MSNRTLLLLLAGAAAIWWFFFRRPPLQGVPVGVPHGGTVDPISAWLGEMLAPGAPLPGLQPLPPVAPTGGSGWKSSAERLGNQAIGTFGNLSEDAFKSLCKSGKACEIGAPIANYAGKATAAVTVKSLEYGAKGAQKVGQLAVTGVKKLKFW